MAVAKEINWAHNRIESQRWQNIEIFSVDQTVYVSGGQCARMLIEYVIYKHGTVILEIGWCDDNYMLHAIYTHFNRPWNFWDRKGEMTKYTQNTKIIFISWFVVFLLLLLKLFWKRYGTIYTRYDFDRFECDVHHHVFTSNFQLWSHLFNPLDCVSAADAVAVATVIHRNDSDYNNNYKFRKSKWASRKTRNNNSGEDITSVWHTRDSSLSRSYMLKIVRCLNERRI